MRLAIRVGYISDRTLPEVIRYAAMIAKRLESLVKAS
jgi:hypothetical protein